MRSPWNRVLWGVNFADSAGKLFLIGTRWHRVSNDNNKGYPGEPSRALLFMTRRQAREFCAHQRAAAIKLGGTCAAWRYTPVRVRETVKQFNGFEKP